MYVNVSQRFIEAVNFLIDSRHLRNQAELTAQLGLSKGYVSQIVTGKREPSEQIVRKFANQYPEINIAWLLTGEGEMLTEKTKNQTVIENNHGTAINGDGAVIHPKEESPDIVKRMQDQIDELLSQNRTLLNIVDRLTSK